MSRAVPTIEPSVSVDAPRRSITLPILDGELVMPDETGRPIFLDLLRRRGTPSYVAFDLLLAGHDLRTLALVERREL